VLLCADRNRGNHGSALIISMALVGDTVENILGGGATRSAECLGS